MPSFANLHNRDPIVRQVLMRKSIASMYHSKTEHKRQDREI